MTGTLIVIAKSPAPGRVKTRLTPPLTPQQAAAVASAALADTLATVAATPAMRRVVCLDGAPGPWLPGGVEVVAQHGDGLAARLANAFADVASFPALLIGMDTPQVTPGLLAHGLRALATHDAVLGEAPDGGYWAIGFARHAAGAFDGVPMSTRMTGRSQRARLRHLGLSVCDLPPLRDVDRIADAHAVAAAAPTGRFARAVAAV